MRHPRRRARRPTIRCRPRTRQQRLRPRRGVSWRWTYPSPNTKARARTRRGAGPGSRSAKTAGIGWISPCADGDGPRNDANHSGEEVGPAPFPLSCVGGHDTERADDLTNQSGIPIATAKTGHGASDVRRAAFLHNSRCRTAPSTTRWKIACGNKKPRRTLRAHGSRTRSSPTERGPSDTPCDESGRSKGGTGADRNSQDDQSKVGPRACDRTPSERRERREGHERFERGLLRRRCGCDQTSRS